MKTLDGNALIHRIIDLKKKKVDVIRELNKRGISCHASRFSDVLNGNYPIRTEKVMEILTNTDKILTDWEAKQAQ
ncbi:MAG: hypothetical protein CVU97_05890 [Firmicutes bacterium HGW-Firmicutes-21]|nr:MAG: hypothetical protein CVU97_05890 [Firmicutes bacterium HGW-Firmicutes-21]